MFLINSLGSDPELILLNKQTNAPVSAIGLNHKSDVISLYADNVLAEFAHTPFNIVDFKDGMKEVLQSVTSAVDKFGDGCTFSIGQCEAEFSSEQLSAPEAHAIGCEPFINAYTDSLSVPSPYQDNYRFAGGHIHIGYDKASLPPHMLIKLLDKELLPLDPNKDSPRRSKFYGAAGSYRDKPYGVEYRSLSNFWLNQPELIEDVLNSIKSYVNTKYYGA